MLTHSFLDMPVPMPSHCRCPKSAASITTDTVHSSCDNTNGWATICTSSQTTRTGMPCHATPFSRAVTANSGWLDGKLAYYSVMRPLERHLSLEIGLAVPLYESLRTFGAYFNLVCFRSGSSANWACLSLNIFSCHHKFAVHICRSWQG